MNDDELRDNFLGAVQKYCEDNGDPDYASRVEVFVPGPTTGRPPRILNWSSNIAPPTLEGLKAAYTANTIIDYVTAAEEEDVVTNDESYILLFLLLTEQLGLTNAQAKTRLRSWVQKARRREARAEQQRRRERQ